MARLLFSGAAREVTGSMHLLQAGERWIALDCGLFQGRRAEVAQKNTSFPMDPSRLHAVVLSHAHIDHSGRLPLLVRQGFTGSIISTPATRDLCAVMLADAAHIQEEDAQYLNRKRGLKGDEAVLPLYNSTDAKAAVRLFQTTSYDRPFHVSGEVRGRFFEAGHILGSAGVELTVSEPSRPPFRLVFTGDVGRFGLPILRDPAPLPSCEYLICESTYGNRTTPTAEGLTEQLGEVIFRTFARGGKVIVPAFSVGRTQTVVYCIHQLIREGRSVPVFVDSPLSVNVTEVFKMHPDCYDGEAVDFLEETGDVLGAGCCTYIRDVEKSKALHRRREPCVIISASGMCENGRILHHLKNNVTDGKNTVLIVGFQAAHTLGRRLVEREREVSIFGKKYPVRAEVVVLNGFSAHADKEELHTLTAPLAAKCRQAFLVHGEPAQMDPFAESLRQGGFRAVETPNAGEEFELG